MSASVLRVIRSGAVHPARNMAIDTALLHADSPLTLRLYGWSPPGLSLGHFQDESAFANLPGDHVVVRRVTGGGAIYHDREITFAVTGPARLFEGTVADSYRRVHESIAAELRRLDVPARSHRASPTTGDMRQAWCFTTPGCGDLVTDDGRKILGSAQRRIRRPSERVLHHGSLLIEAPAVMPGSAGVAEFCTIDIAELSDALVLAIARAFAREPVSGELDPLELEQIERQGVESVTTS